MKIWIARAEPGAGRTAERVRALGHDPLVAPVLQVRSLPGEVDLDGVGALAFTSPNGVGAFAARCADRGLPVFAVGAATARAARTAGFAAVASADGDVAALAALIAASRDRFAGLVLAPGALEPAGDLLGGLYAKGVSARVQAIYETCAIDAPQALRLLSELDVVLVHSPKGGRRLAETLAGHEVGHLAALCISAEAAAPLAGLPLKSSTVAARPDEQSLFALLR